MCTVASAPGWAQRLSMGDYLRGREPEDWPTAPPPPEGLMSSTLFDIKCRAPVSHNR
jgi:hypothetical protein